MVENAIRLSVDTVVPPPDSTAWPPCKKHLIFYDNLLENNKFQLIFDERDDAESLIKLYGGLLL
jgi:tubulin polyglutamylase TTLL1/tubulin monoglycylase TTLL3/8